MTIDDALRWAKSQLAEPSEAYYLVSDIIGKPRSYLYTWPDAELTGEYVERLKAAVKRRAQGEPVAYILGKKAFWTFSLKTSEHTLIPRPETELLVETALELGTQDQHLQVCDLGTGTGAIALAIASERAKWTVTGVDRIAEAVDLATQNAVELGINNVRFLQSHWFTALSEQVFDMIVSNPPYVEPTSPYLEEGDVQFEPRSALVAENDGLADILLIISRAKAHLKPRGWLMFEHGYNQHEAVKQAMQQAGFVDIRAIEDLNRYQRVTLGQLNTDDSKTADN